MINVAIKSPGIQYSGEADNHPATAFSAGRKVTVRFFDRFRALPARHRYGRRGLSCSWRTPYRILALIFILVTIYFPLREHSGTWGFPCLARATETAGWPAKDERRQTGISAAIHGRHEMQRLICADTQPLEGDRDDGTTANWCSSCRFCKCNKLLMQATFSYQWKDNLREKKNI